MSESKDVEFVMSVDLGYLIDLDTDRMNNLACETYGSHDLQGIDYTALGVTENNDIRIKVTGYVEEEDNE